MGMYFSIWPYSKLKTCFNGRESKNEKCSLLQLSGFRHIEVRDTFLKDN